jgi:hypothetical protein
MTICVKCRWCSIENAYDKFETKNHVCNILTKIDFVTGIEYSDYIECYSKNTSGDCEDFEFKFNDIEYSTSLRQEW